MYTVSMKRFDRTILTVEVPDFVRFEYPVYLKFGAMAANFTEAEARQLAVALIGAADDHAANKNARRATCTPE